MRYLLDTHVLLWWLAKDARLSSNVLKSISAFENLIFISAASVWEISIKQSLGKLSIPSNLLEMLKKNEFQTLDISAEHALKIRELPLIHKDPFDRMLIAQAIVEGLTLISNDKKFKNYNVPLLDA